MSCIGERIDLEEVAIMGLIDELFKREEMAELLLQYKIIETDTEQDGDKMIVTIVFERIKEDK